MNLNLLVLLDALLAERNVSRTARRLGLSQPALSNALARLRATLGDPLLVRRPGGMLPTPRAEALIPMLRDVLSRIERLVAVPRAFDPQTSQQSFSVGSTDFTELVLVPRLAPRLGPGLRLRMKTLREQHPSPQLERGELDLAIGYFPQAGPGLFQQLLFEEEFVVVAREKNPLARKPLTLERYAAAPHLLVAPWGGITGVVDRILAEHGLARQVKLTTAHFLSAPLVIAETDCIATLPRRVAETLRRPLRLKLLAPPAAVPGFPVTQLWHARTHHDPAHRWFRAECRAAVKART
jgi:DNA-binding transcriptional LysR family regulator